MLHQITAIVLDALEREGKPVGPGTLLAVQQLLNKLPQDISPEVLCLRLTPLLVNNPQEQERVYELFREAHQKADDLKGVKLPYAPVRKKKDQQPGLWRVLLVMVTLFLFIAAPLELWYLSESDNAEFADNQAALDDEEKRNLFLEDSIRRSVSPLRETDRYYEEINYPYPHSMESITRILPQSDWQIWMDQNWNWIRWLLLLPLTGVCWGSWRYLEYRRRKLIAEQERKDKPPYSWSITIPGAAEDIIVGEGYQHILQVLRRRETIDLHLLDIPRTVRTTASKGGLPVFQYLPKTEPVEYLILIDRQSSENHRARLFDTLFQTFKDQEIEIARYYFDSDIRLCFNEAYTYGIGIRELQQKYYNARLLVIGTGMQLLSPKTARPYSWTGIFSQWRHRLLLTPKPLMLWNQEEQHLSEVFRVLPATLQALSYWLEEIETTGETRLDLWRDHVKDAPIVPVVPDDKDPLVVLQQNYSTGMMCWISACAIFPAIHWDLTLWLGKEINRVKPNSIPLFDESPMEVLLHLFRLSWFVNGAIPEPSRKTLLNWLSETDPKLLHYLRRALVTTLEQNPPPADAVAYDEYRMNLALQNWLTTTNRAQKAELEKEIARLLAAGQEADFTVVKALKRPRTSLDFILPDTWKRHVHTGGFSALGWKGKWKDLLWILPVWLLGCIGLFWPYQFIQDDCKGNIINYKGADYCLDSPADSIVWMEHLACQAVEERNPGVLTNFNAMVYHIYTNPSNDSIDLDVAVQRYYGNLAASLYNTGVRIHNEGADTTEICTYFRLAWVADSVVLRNLVTTIRNECPDITGFSYSGEVDASSVVKPPGDTTNAVKSRDEAGVTILGPMKGMVVDRVTRNGIPGVKVLHSIGSQPLDIRALSEDGGFILNLPKYWKSTSVRLFVSAPGYVDTFFIVRVDNVKEFPELTLRKSLLGKREYKIKGTIVDELRRPISGAIVSAEPYDLETSRNSGEFILRLPKDDYPAVIILNITQKGYKPILYRVILGVNEVISIPSIELKTEKSIVVNSTDKALVISPVYVKANEISKKDPSKKRETKSAGKAGELQICWVVEPTKGVGPGEQNFHIQIIDQTGTTIGAGIAFDKASGGQYRYTMEEFMIYDGAQAQVCAYFKSTDFSTGTYDVNIWSNGYKVGTSSVTLKK